MRSKPLEARTAVVRVVRVDASACNARWLGSKDSPRHGRTVRGPSGLATGGIFFTALMPVSFGPIPGHADGRHGDRGVDVIVGMIVIVAVIMSMMMIVVMVVVVVM